MVAESSSSDYERRIRAAERLFSRGTSRIANRVGRKIEVSTVALDQLSTTPKAAHESEQPTSLSSPLVRSSLAALSLYSWERISDTTSTSCHHHPITAEGRERSVSRSDSTAARQGRQLQLHSSRELSVSVRRVGNVRAQPRDNASKAPKASRSDEKAG